VQDALETALEPIAGAKVSTTAAGRTDRGVHARLQVVHFDTDAQRPASAWVRGVNTLLPDAVAVLWSREVPGDFHARYSALARTYRYELLNRPVRAALSAPYAGWFHQPLDVGAMRAAAALLVGEHDFSAFRSSECQAKTPVRKIHSLEISRQAESIFFEIRANAFLHHMVRNLVGTLVYVGKGSLLPAQVKEILQARDRSKAPPTFASEGLYLEKIEYEPKWQLPT
jgi:tRNA pseudouridine38-40 synthase